MSTKVVKSVTNYTYLRVDGRPANQMANNDIIKLVKSVSKCAASVAMASELEYTPPITSKIMNTKHKMLAIMSFFRASTSIPSVRSLSVWQCPKMWEMKFLISNFIQLKFTIFIWHRHIVSTLNNRISTYSRSGWARPLVHCSNSSINVRANNRLWLVNHLVSLRRTIYCHKN